LRETKKGKVINMAKEIQQEATPAVQKRAAGRKKKPGHLPVNLFDVAAILVVVALIALAISGTQLSNVFGFDTVGEDCTVEYMIMFADVDQDLALSVSEGNTVYGGAGTAYMGEVITSPEVQPYRVVAYADGAAQMKEKPGAVNVIVTVRAEATYTEGEGYRVGETAVRVGDTLSLRFPGYTGVGSCINISRTSD
jgi:hypothetical protein